MSLKEVPQDIPDSVTGLDLSFNIINILPNNSFVKLKHLEFLRLSNNEIKYIHENAFVGLENLKYLHLEQNDLSYLHPETFNKGLNKLLNVYLTGNEFQKIPVLKATAMTKLNLDSNKISDAYIDESFLLNTKLQTLDLTHNYISVINEFDLKNLKNTQLLTLKLKFNNLQNITSEAFSHIKNSIQNLELEENKLLNSEIIENALKGLNQAFGMQYLDLKNCNLTSVSDNFLKPFFGTKLHRLDLSRNPQLSFIAENAFDGLKKVQILHLEKCKLTSANIRFSSMDQLKELDLSDNGLQSCPTRLPASLQMIDLQSNDIRHIQKDNFKSLTNLKHIYLQKNSILSIEMESFSDLTNLLSLNLGFNRLSKIDSGIFSPMPSLEVLNLEGQKSCLSSINPRSFVLSNLKSLELQDNCIMLKDTESRLFANVPQLTNLSLKANHLKHLTGGLFIGSTNIQFIDLSMNDISSWAPAAFNPLVPSVIDINLKSNKLSFISYKSSSNNYLPNNFQSLRRIYLENNVWNCTCADVIWMLHFAEKIPNNEKIICQYPNEKIGRKLFSIMKNCSEPSKNPFIIHNNRTTNSSSFVKVFSIIMISAFVGFLLLLYRFRFIVRRWLLRIMKKNNHSYRHLNDTGNDNTSCYSNPIQNELIENTESNGVSGSLQFRNDDIGNLQSDENQSFNDSIPEDFDADIVVLSENDELKIEHDKIRIRFYYDLSSPDDLKIVQLCDCLVIESSFSNIGTIKKILNTRKNKTFIFHKSDDSRNNFQSQYPENEYLEFKNYEHTDMTLLYYEIL